MLIKCKIASLLCICSMWKNFSSHLQVRSIILCNKRTVTLTQHRDLLLNVFYFILRLLQVYDFNGHHLFGAIIDAFIDLSKGTLSNPLLLGEVFLRVQSAILFEGQQWNDITIKYVRIIMIGMCVSCLSHEQH